RPAPPAPSPGVTSATMCVSTPTCAASPTANGIDTLQNRQVLNAPLTPGRALGGEPRGDVGMGPPSGPSPRSSGPRPSTAATAISAPREASGAGPSAPRKPTAPMSGSSDGATRTPPSVAPVTPMLTASPRRRSHHGARMMLTAAPLSVPQPTDITRNAG